MQSYPITVAADCQGRVIDLPGLAAAGRSGHTIYPLDGARLIPLPVDSDLYLLPARQALGFAADSRMLAAGDQYTAAAAFLPPGYTALSLAATLACLMTGAVAGLYFNKSSTCLLKLAPSTPSSQSTSAIPVDPNCRTAYY